MKDLPPTMTDAAEPASPCAAICVLDDGGYCLGCERHIDEIVGWAQLSRERKLDVLSELPERRRRRDWQPR
jgi:predicted Fe-S protein YdhL (DUF1289 family)